MSSMYCFVQIDGLTIGAHCLAFLSQPLNLYLSWGMRADGNGTVDSGKQALEVTRERCADCQCYHRLPLTQLWLLFSDACRLQAAFCIGGFL